MLKSIIHCQTDDTYKRLKSGQEHTIGSSSFLSWAVSIAPEKAISFAAIYYCVYQNRRQHIIFLVCVFSLHALSHISGSWNENY